MKILVTGGAGFIGSHVVERLLAEKHTVHCVDNLSLGKQEHVAMFETNPLYTFTKLDLAEKIKVQEVFSTFKPEAVIHLAANSDIGAGAYDLNVDLINTFGSTISVLEAIAECPSVTNLLFASTSAIYGSLPEVITETTGPLIPQSNYGAAKLASEAFIDAFAHLKNIKTWIFRFPNVCGPRATHGVFYNFRKFLKTDPTRISVAQDGTQAKPYIYVTDLVDASMLGWKNSSELITIYNVGNQPLVSVNEILGFYLEELSLKDVAIEYTNTPGWPGDVATYTYDDSKLRSLGYVPRFTATEAAHQTVKDLVAEQHSAR
jgi:UDP-glucose 4-epimerase